MPLPAIALAALAAGGTGYGLSQMMRRRGGSGGGSIDLSQFRDRGADRKFNPSAVREIYRQALGREPNQNEVIQFQKYYQAGDLEYQDIAEIVGGLPEAQGNMLRSQTTDLEGRLAASDDTILGRAMESLESRYRQLGRPQTSGFDSSFARSAQDLAMSRQDALNNFYSSGLTGLRGAYAARSEGARSRGYDLSDTRTDYNRALNLAALGQAYQSSREDKSLALQRQMASGQLFGTLAGAGLGLAAGGAPGAYFGGQIGSALGTNYGLLRR